ncbi:murein hydrolase activator EnvC family protein [Cellulomonas soli]|uniref:M23ase beta-sheet core domain-containing protein n=1 Tax=Cellulomonas soli TaxID=931535 RepID=A0A512PBC6_9CELL|nr:M23 family metallopeptidase [Cellulomonas soli]NYI61070.1 murein DD-endopeptidase MepM/ murein hydrolase activator NlpD [Cellulomonas soli]GEP68513.1 hypothetical protein CSO01_12280 [Cellulomonas soli]
MASPLPGARGRPALVGTLALLVGGILPGLAAADASPTPASPGTTTSPAYAAPTDGAPTLLRPFERPAEVWAPGHRGVDLAAEPGSRVLAPVDGTVSFAGPVAGRGIVTVVDADGLRSSLEPVDPVVATGQGVHRGDVVATVSTDAAASSHCAPATCLHWGVRRGTDYLDPMDLLGAPGPVVLLPDR